MKIFFGFNVYFSMKMLYFPPCFSISLCRNIEWGPGKKSRQKMSPSIVVHAKKNGKIGNAENTMDEHMKNQCSVSSTKYYSARRSCAASWLLSINETLGSRLLISSSLRFRSFLFFRSSFLSVFIIFCLS